MVQYKKFKVGASYVIRGHEVVNDDDGIFVIKPTKRRINAKDAKVKGPFNYVSRGTTNNGIASKIQYDSQYLNESHTLSFAQDTAAIFYQDKPYFTGNKVNVFQLNKKYGELTDELGLYLCGAIRLAFPDFKWGTLLNIEKIANTDIMLPVTPAGDPDFKYMTMRIRELEAERIRKLEAYLQVTGLDDTTLSASESQALTQKVQWKKFTLGSLLDFESVRQAKSQKAIPDDNNKITRIPYIVQSMSNNMFRRNVNRQYLVDNNEPIVKGNCIVLGVTLPAVSYQPDEFGGSQLIIGRAKDNWMNSETGLFLATAIKVHMSEFSYNHKPGMKIYKNMDVVLPVTPAGEIDFNYMQNYIRATEKQTIEGVVEYKDKVIEETKKVVNG